MRLFVEEPNWKSLIDEISNEYYKLLLIIGPSQSGKTHLLRDIGSSYGFAHINLGEVKFIKTPIIYLQFSTILFY